MQRISQVLGAISSPAKLFSVWLWSFPPRHLDFSWEGPGFMFSTGLHQGDATLCLWKLALEVAVWKFPILFITFRGCSLSGLRTFLHNLSVYIQQNVEQPTFYREQETSKTRQLQIMIVSILQEWNTSELIASFLAFSEQYIWTTEKFELCFWTLI